MLGRSNGERRTGTSVGNEKAPAPLGAWGNKAKVDELKKSMAGPGAAAPGKPVAKAPNPVPAPQKPVAQAPAVVPKQEPVLQNAVGEVPKVPELDPAKVIPGKGLNAHENARVGKKGKSTGHTMDRHVGKSGDDLEKRLTDDAKLSMASSFGDLAEAESAVAKAIDQNQSDIDSWLNQEGGPGRKTIRATIDGGIGSVLSRGQAGPASGEEVVVVLAKPHRSVNDMSYVILTAYPTRTT